MNKSELVDKIAEKTDVSKADTEKVLKAFEETVQEVVAKGKEKLTLAGFVSFEQTKRKARTARNPQTGEPINVPAQNAVKVTPGATLKKTAKEGKAPK